MGCLVGRGRVGILSPGTVLLGLGGAVDRELDSCTVERTRVELTGLGLGI